MTDAYTDSDYDYGEDSRSPKIGDNIKKALLEAANRQEELEVKIAKLTAELETEQGKLRQLAEITIPQIMDGMFGSWDLGDGRFLEISEKIRASIAGEKAAPACEWLDSHNHGSIIKRQFVIEFNKEDEAWAKKFEADLRKRRKPLNVKRKNTVHPATLEAFVKEQLSNGVDIPQKIFGVYRQKISKVIRPDLEKKPRRSKKDQSDIPDF
jgi:hypothetical protein